MKLISALEINSVLDFHFYFYTN